MDIGVLQQPAGMLLKALIVVDKCFSACPCGHSVISRVYKLCFGQSVCSLFMPMRKCFSASCMIFVLRCACPVRNRTPALFSAVLPALYMQALCIGVTLAAYLNLLARKQAAEGTHVSGSSSQELNSSGNGISTSNKPRCQLLTQQALQLDDAAWEAAEVRSWQSACEQHAVLPDTHHKLLKAVGCSSKAMVWAAVSLHISTVEYQSKAANMWGLINAYQELVEVLYSGKLESATVGASASVHPGSRGSKWLLAVR